MALGEMISALLAAIAGIIESVYSIMQVLGLASSGHTLYSITGHFSNPGPLGGFLAVTAAVCASVLIKERNSGKTRRVILWICGISCALSFVVLPSTMSRAGWLALAVPSGVALLRDEQVRKWIEARKWLFPCALVIAAALCIGAFTLKKDSALGRLHIWRIECMAIAQNPAGTGKGSVLGTFGKTQEAFFRERLDDLPQSVVDVAGCPEFAFNEYLRVGVEYGVAVMALFLVTLFAALWVLLKKRSPLAYGLMAWMIFAFFSYPMHFMAFRIALGVFLVAAALESGLCAPLKYALAFAALALSAAIAFVPRDDAAFRAIYAEGYAQYGAGEYEESLRTLARGAEISSDPMFHNIMGRDCEELGRYEDARDEYLRAHYMVPSRLYPLVRLMRLDIRRGDNAGAMALGEQIMRMPLNERNLSMVRLHNETAASLDSLKNTCDLRERALQFLKDGLAAQWHYDVRALEETGMMTKVADAGVVDDAYLEENVEYALKAWELPWCRNLSFDEFCSIILPYKVGNEEPERWRRELWEEFSWVLDRADENTTASDVCRWINDTVNTWYSVTLDYNYPVDAGYMKAKEIKRGTCYGASMMIMYPLRALGVPVTFDYVPRWANRSGDHNWNALYDDGALVTFNGPDRNPGEHKIEFIGVGRMLFKRPKVYRKEYSAAGYSDVTKEYIPVSDITLKVARKYSSVSLSTFDNRNWMPVSEAALSGGKALFKDMAREVVYLPVGNTEMGEQYALDWPLLVTAEGKLKQMRPSPLLRRKVRLAAKYPEDASNLIFEGERYELFYWNGRWKSLGEQVAEGDFLEYRSVPSNALLWLRNLDKGVQERIFIYEGGKQIWY